MADFRAWRVSGDWFDVCKCNIPCPCTFAQPPTYGDCQAVLAYHIREGHYGDVPLDGLNLVAVATFEVEVAADLSHWRAEIPGKVLASAEALGGPTTASGERVQTLNPPGSEV